MMTGVGLLDSSGRNPHVHQPEPHLHFRPHVCPVDGMHKIDLRTGRRGMSLCGACGGRGSRGDDADLNTGRHDRRRMRDMIFISKHQLQSVFTGCELDFGLSLSSAEMQMVEIVRYRLIEWRERHIDQNVMMA